MKKSMAITALSLVLVMNIGSGYTRRIDHRLSTIESSLFEKLENRECTEQALELERKTKSRATPCQAS